MYSKCHRLFRSPSMPCGVIRPVLKRLERPQDRDLPIQNKRRKSITPLEEQLEAEEPVSALLLGWGCPVLTQGARKVGVLARWGMEGWPPL